MSIFWAERVIQNINDTGVSTYFVDFELQDDNTYQYRWSALINLMQKALVDFAYGIHEWWSVANQDIQEKLVEAARSIYQIKEFQETKRIYEEWNADNDEEKKYLRRGEFGELILHILLRDFHSTIPLLSKIYFKDSYNHTVHGFDAVHIQGSTKTLWLWESKLYTDSKAGIDNLIGDIKTHFQSNYLRSEFSIISKKVRWSNIVDIVDRDFWLNLMNNQTKLQKILNSVTIPLLCTYSSWNFDTYSGTLEGKIKQESKDLKAYFDRKNDHPLKTHLNILLLLFPVRCKKELVKRMHEKLFTIQSLND